MATPYIDLKNCQFFYQDGYKVNATVGSAGATQGATSVPLSGITGVLSVGVVLSIAGDPTIYYVTTTTETGGNTTAVTVQPPLNVAAASGTAVVAGPHSLEITIGDGNLTYDESRNLEYKLNRGKLDQVRLGDDVPVDVNFNFAYTYLSMPAGASTPSPEEFMKQTGPASLFVTAGQPCQPYAINIVMINKVPACGSEQYPWERLVLPEFRFEKLAHDPKAGTVTASGKCNSTVALKTRLAAS